MGLGGNIFAVIMSLAGSAMAVQTCINNLVPEEFRRSFVSSLINNIQSHLCQELTIVIEEKDKYNLNDVHQATMAYLSFKVSSSMNKIKVQKHFDDKKLIVSLGAGEDVIDVFEGIKFRWCLHYPSKQRRSLEESGISSDSNYFELSFHKKHKDKALDCYIPSILEWWKKFKREEKKLQLFANDYDEWISINHNHPSTFETMAMELDLKQIVMEDLTNFVNRKDYYRKIGKAWKRGYLLYGPPGTGKSSLICAMANFLKFDIYGLDLAGVRNVATLKSLLIETSNKSIIVIEDIDCSVPLQNRDSEDMDDNDTKVTLSSLLNLVDGLWSSCGEEKIIVFTTNYKERLDPALLRPGRMDMHIYMGYCSPYMFRILASNYHDVNEHPLFEKIEALIQDVEVTPAAVAEELMRSNDCDIALGRLLNYLRCKKQEKVEASEADTRSEIID